MCRKDVVDDLLYKKTVTLSCQICTITSTSLHDQINRTVSFQKATLLKDGSYVQMLCDSLLYFINKVHVNIVNVNFYVLCLKNT